MATVAIESTVQQFLEANKDRVWNLLKVTTLLAIKQDDNDVNEKACGYIQ